MKTSFLFYLVIFVSECSVCMQALEPRVKCTKSKNGLSAVVPYEIIQIPQSLEGCYLGGSAPLPPGAPLVTFSKQGNIITLKIEPPDNGSILFLRGYLLEVYVTGEPFNIYPECCYFVNFTQINNSANGKLKDIIEAAVSIKCVYSGAHSSNITVFTNSFPEPSGTRAQKSDMKVIQVPGTVASRKVPGVLKPPPKTLPAAQTTSTVSTKPAETSATTYVVMTILAFSILLSVIITITVTVYVKRQRHRTERLTIDSDII